MLLVKNKNSKLWMVCSSFCLIPKNYCVERNEPIFPEHETTTNLLDRGPCPRCYDRDRRICSRTRSGTRGRSQSWSRCRTVFLSVLGLAQEVVLGIINWRWLKSEKCPTKHIIVQFENYRKNSNRLKRYKFLSYFIYFKFHVLS